MCTEKSSIELKTKTEHLLYGHYCDEKNARRKLEETVRHLEEQIHLLQQKLKTVTEPKAPEKKEIEKKPSSQVEFSTDEEELAKETEWIRTKSRKKRKLNTSPTQISDKEERNEDIKEKVRAKKVPLPPPIIVDNIKNYQSFFDLLIEKQPGGSFTIKIMHGETVKVNAENETVYRSITEFLTADGYHWHSYENKQCRPIRVIVKKLHHTCKPDRIVEDLKTKGYKIEEAVNKLRWKDKTPLNMFMLTFNNAEDINKIYEIKSILGCKIEMHPLKTSKLVPQCKRCQAYGHTQKYCAKDPRCVKCTGKHLTKDCKKPAEEKPKCVHCGAPHPANYRGCMVAKEMQNLKNKATKKTKDTNIAITPKESRRVSKNLTFAQIASGNPNKSSNHTDSVDGKLNQILSLMSTFDERLKKLENSNKIATSTSKK